MRTRGVGLLYLDHKAGLLKAAVNPEKRGGMSVDDCYWEGWKQLVGYRPVARLDLPPLVVGLALQFTPVNIEDFQAAVMYLYKYCLTTVAPLTSVLMDVKRQHCNIAICELPLGI
jgi:hypothetical protein